MDSQFDVWQLTALAAALGWASGIRLYAVLFIVGGLGFLRWIELPGGLAGLERAGLGAGLARVPDDAHAPGFRKNLAHVPEQRSHGLERGNAGQLGQVVLRAFCHAHAVGIGHPAEHVRDGFVDLGGNLQRRG